MKLIVDNLNSVTGWSASGTGFIHGLNDHDQYISGYNDKSIVFGFANIGDYVEKTYGTDVSDYDQLTLYLFSREKQERGFRKPSDFHYKIDLGTGKEYYLSTWIGFTFITIDISNINTIDRIRITSLTDGADYIIASYLVVSKDEFPLDIFTGIKEGMEIYRDTLETFLLGTVDTTLNDSEIDLSDFVFVDNYAVIEITNGSVSEFHQLIRGHEGVFEFTKLYDGDRILYNFVNADVFLHTPVEFGRESLEAIIPGITIWGFESDQLLLSFGIENVLDTWTDSGAAERREGHYRRYPIQFDCEARQSEILARLSRVVRDFIGRRFVYVNGRKFRIEFDGSPIETRPTEHYDTIPKILYRGSIEIKEELWQRINLPLTSTINIQVMIQ